MFGTGKMCYLYELISCVVAENTIVARELFHTANIFNRTATTP